MRNVNGKWWVAAIAGAILAGSPNPGRADGNQTAGYTVPRMVIPYVGDHPPKIDGVIESAEYKDFAALTGVVTWKGTVVPLIQQVVWYLGYDDKYLYISMHSPNPPGIWPISRIKKNDGGLAILWDDHVEIQIAKERATATLLGHGFYKIMVNPKGFITDEWYYNGTVGTEAEWSLAGPVKCSVTKDYWDMEIAVDIRAFGEKRLDGKTWILQLVRTDSCGGIYYAGWVGCDWMQWKQFGEVTFARTPPVFRLLETGELAKGDMKLGFEVVGRDAAPTPVTVKVSATDGSGKAIYNDTKTETVGKGAVKKMRFEQALPLTDAGNKVEILATCPATGPDNASSATILYNVQLPIIKLTDKYYEGQIAPWLKGRPKGDFSWSFAYWPSYNLARAEYDADFFGIKDELEAASAFEISVTKKGGTKPLAAQKTEIKDKVGRMVMKGMTLPEGDYVAKISVIGKDGRTVVGTRQMEFPRRRYPWENSTQGLSNKVIPPFTPIEVDAGKQELKVWARTYTLGADGLPRKIVAGGGPGPEDILRDPIQFAARAAGAEAKVTDVKLTAGKAEPGHVEFSSAGRLGSVAYKLNTYLEYDGWYSVKLTLDPEGKEAALDGLSLDIPLWKAADTVYIQRVADGRSGNLFGAIPAGTGLVWESSRLIPCGEWKSFCPIVFLGTGDKGLWWFAEQNRDWKMSDKKAAVEIYRRDAGIDLRVNVFAEPVTFKTPRTIEFALLVDPVKQMPDERKVAWGKLPYCHNTFGYRYWGGSVDGYENSDAGLAGLNAVITDPDWKPNPAVTNRICLNHVNAFRNQVHEGYTKQQKISVYGSTWLLGAGLEGLETYGGEWRGNSNFQPDPDGEFREWWNAQTTKEFKSDRDLTVTWIPPLDSYINCFVWHHQRLLSKTPINGTWWDNASIGSFEDYDPQRGEFYSRFNIFARRQLMKRLCNVGLDAGREPWWISNMHVDWSFNQIAWHVENDFYISNADMTMTEQLNVNEFRALCRTKRGIIHRLSAQVVPGGSAEQVRRTGRSIIGMCLLHDIGSYLAYGNPDTLVADGMLKVVDAAVGFFDGAEFVGYWRSAPLIRIGTPGVYASVYRGRDHAVIVVVNERREDVDVPFELGKDILPGKVVQKVYDGETGSVMAPRYDDAQKKPVWGELKPGLFGIANRGVRLLVVE